MYKINKNKENLIEICYNIARFRKVYDGVVLNKEMGNERIEINRSDQ